MINIGVDIVELSRVDEVLAEWGDKFLARVFTEREIEMYGDRKESLAARFAAKEAVIKALDAAGRGVSFKDIEVLSSASGRPVVRLTGKAREIADAASIKDLTVSLSHSRTNAVAMAAGIRK
jgi:holo-[acyl-carrier protein] synthase